MKGNFKSKYSTLNYILGKLSLYTNAVISSDGDGKNWPGYCLIKFFCFYRALVPFPNALPGHPGQCHTYTEKIQILQLFSQVLNSYSDSLSLVGLQGSTEKNNHSTMDQTKTAIFY